MVQLLPDGGVLRPEGHRGRGQEPRAVGQLRGVSGDLFELQLRAKDRPTDRRTDGGSIQPHRRQANWWGGRASEYVYNSRRRKTIFTRWNNRGPLTLSKHKGCKEALMKGESYLCMLASYTSLPCAEFAVRRSNWSAIAAIEHRSQSPVSSIRGIRDRGVTHSCFRRQQRREAQSAPGRLGTSVSHTRPNASRPQSRIGRNP